MCWYSGRKGRQHTFTIFHRKSPAFLNNRYILIKSYQLFFLSLACPANPMFPRVYLTINHINRELYILSLSSSIIQIIWYYFILFSQTMFVPKPNYMHIEIKVYFILCLLGQFYFSFFHSRLRTLYQAGIYRIYIKKWNFYTLGVARSPALSLFLPPEASQWNPRTSGAYLMAKVQQFNPSFYSFPVLGRYFRKKCEAAPEKQSDRTNSGGDLYSRLILILLASLGREIECSVRWEDFSSLLSAKLLHSFSLSFSFTFYF